MNFEDKANIEEGRRLLQAIGEKVAGKSQFDIMRIMAAVGLASLRMAKINMDAAKAAQEMQRRICAGPRPTPKEAGLN